MRDKKIGITQDKYIKSPLNYIGGKYKLLNQIVRYFPKNIDTFYDLFAGGCDVAINIKANKIVVNEINDSLINLYRFIYETELEKLIEQIQKVIVEYELSDTSKNGYKYYGTDSSIGLKKINNSSYIKLRENFNHCTLSNINKNVAFYVLIAFSFNNQIRFNKSGYFNTPCGKRDFNKSLKNKFINFKKEMISKNLIFTSQSYEFFLDNQFSKNDFLYIDPPYLISMAPYNENNLWNEKKEIELYNNLNKIHNKNVKFALSNVLIHNGKVNRILEQWMKKYYVHYLDSNYNNSNYQKKNKQKTVEVLITNFKSK